MIGFLVWPELKALAVIADLQQNLLPGVEQLDLQVFGIGVVDDIGHRFLGDPVDALLDIGR
jgi:hypothetical protein